MQEENRTLLSISSSSRPFRLQTVSFTARKSSPLSPCSECARDGNFLIGRMTRKYNYVGVECRAPHKLPRVLFNLPALISINDHLFTPFSCYQLVVPETALWHFGPASPLPFWPTSFLSALLFPFLTLISLSRPHSKATCFPELPATGVPSPSHRIFSVLLKHGVFHSSWAPVFFCLVRGPQPVSCPRGTPGLFIFGPPPRPHSHPQAPKTYLLGAKYVFVDLKCWTWNKRHCFQKNFLRCKQSKCSEQAWTENALNCQKC